MGAADIVPGVSGGTVALILGIYDKLIYTLSSFDHHFFKSLIKLDIKMAFKDIDIRFLITLFLGIISSIILGAKLIHFLLDNYPIYMWSSFFGMIASSVIVLIKKCAHPIRSNTIPAIIIGVVIGSLIVTMTPVQTPNTNFYILLAGLIAICAMILPGISGSFLLLILGKYEFITGAIKSFSSLENIKILIIFSLGCFIGLVSFSKLLKYALKKQYNFVLAMMCGFMIGSLQKIWPWRKVIESKIIRGKTYILKELNYIPNFDKEFYISLFLLLSTFVLILYFDKKLKKSGALV